MPKLLLVNNLHISQSHVTAEKMWVMTRLYSGGYAKQSAALQRRLC